MIKNDEKNEIKSAHKRWIYDLILVLVIIAIATVALVYLRCFKPEGEYVKVIIDGKEAGVYSLLSDEEVLIETEGGAFFNKLIIKDGYAYVAEANCADEICVEHRPISKSGETIVCLPHKLVIVIEGENNG